jgi:hypothetical protein
MLGLRYLVSIRRKIRGFVRWGKSWFRLGKERKLRLLKIRVLRLRRKLLKNCKCIVFSNKNSKTTSNCSRKSIKTPRFHKISMRPCCKISVKRNNSWMNMIRILTNSQKTKGQWCRDVIKHTRKEKLVKRMKKKIMGSFEIVDFSNLLTFKSF